MNNVVILLTWKNVQWNDIAKRQVMIRHTYLYVLPCNTPRWQDLALLPSNSQFKFFFLLDKMKPGTFNIFPFLS